MGIARLSATDIAVLIVYLAATVVIGVLATRLKSGPESYFLASRSARWPTIGLSLLASNISSTTLIGLAGAAYAVGISVYNYEWMAAVVLVVFCLFFLPVVLASRVYTMPEFLERRFDLSVRLYFSGLTIFLNIIVDTAGTLFGGAVMFGLIFPDAPLWQIAAALAVCSAFYTVLGGLRAVMATEVVQAVVLLSTSVVVAYFAFDQAGGWARVMAEVPPEKLSLIRPINEEGVPWIGLLTGVPLIGFYFWCTNQFMVQRILAAKSIEHGRWGSLFAGLLKLPVLFVMVLPGSAALLLFPTLERADLVYPTLVFNLLPIGLVGLVTAAFLGAIMSSTASTFNSASTLITMDFVSRFRPGMSPAALVAVGRIATVIVMLLAVAWVPVVSAVSDTLWQYLQSVLAYAVTPIVALFAGGVLSARINARGARAGILVGIVTGAALFWAGPVAGVWKLHFLVAAALIFAASLAALALASRTAPPPDPAQIGPLLWTTALWRADSVAMANRPAWQNYRLQSVLLLALTAAIVWVFR